MKLRELRETDIPVMFEMTSDPEVSRHMRFDTHTSLSEAEALYGDYTTAGNFAYMAEDNGEVIGLAALKLVKAQEQEYSVTFFLRKSAWGKGYGSRLAELLLEKARESGEVRSILGYVAEENVASAKLLLKVGFELFDEFEVDDANSGAKSSVMIYKYII